MRTLTFTDEEYAWLEEFVRTRDYPGLMALCVENAIRRAQTDMSEQLLLQMIDELAEAIRLLAQDRNDEATHIADHVEDAVNEQMRPTQ